MRKARTVAYVAGGLVVLLIGGALIFAASIDLNSYRGEIATQVKAATGRQLVISGEVSGTVLSFSPSIVANDVTFANAPWGAKRSMVQAKRIEIRVGLWSLVTGELNVKRLVVSGADIFLESSADRVGNWEFDNLDGRRKANAATTSGDQAIPAFKNVQIIDSTITYRNDAAKEETKFGFKTLSARTESRSSRLQLDIDGNFNGVDLRTTGSVGSIDSFLSRDSRYPIKLQLSYGKSDMKMDLRFDRSAQVSRISGSLTATRLDIDRLAGGAAGKSAKKGSGRLFSAAELPWKLMRVLDADVDVMVETLIAGGQRMTGAKTKISLKNGELRISPFTAAVAGGTFRTDLVFDGTGKTPVLSLKVKAQNLAMAEVTQIWFDKAAVAGRLNLDANLAGRGASPRALVASLRGPVIALMGQGPIRSQFFDLLSSSLVTTIKSWTQKGQDLALTCVVGRFDFAQGIGRSRVLVIDTTRMSLIGGGTINLRDETLNLLLVPKTKQVSVASVGALVPIRISGRLNNPSVAPDPTGVAKEAAKSVIDIAKLPVGLVGSVLGTNSKTTARNASPCSWARARALGKAPPASTTGSNPNAPKTKSKPASTGKTKNLLDKLNPFK